MLRVSGCVLGAWVCLLSTYLSLQCVTGRCSSRCVKSMLINNTAQKRSGSCKMMTDGPHSLAWYKAKSLLLYLGKGLNLFYLKIDMCLPVSFADVSPGFLASVPPLSLSDSFLAWLDPPPLPSVSSPSLSLRGPPPRRSSLKNTHPTLCLNPLNQPPACPLSVLSAEKRHRITISYSCPSPTSHNTLSPTYLLQITQTWLPSKTFTSSANSVKN